MSAARHADLEHWAPAMPLNEARRVAQVHALDILDTPPERRFDDITHAAARIFGVPVALISIIDESRQWFKSAHGLDLSETPRSISFCGYAILEPDQVFVVPDTHEDERFRANPLVVDEPSIQFYAGMPIRGPGGAPLGTLCVIDSAPRAFNAEDQRMLRGLARWAEGELALRAASAVGDVEVPVDPDREA